MRCSCVCDGGVFLHSSEKQLESNFVHIFVKSFARICCKTWIWVHSYSFCVVLLRIRVGYLPCVCITNCNLPIHCSGLSAEAKRKVEAQIAALEEELEEERTQAELATDRSRRLQMQVDQLTNELNSERANSQKLENTKMALDRQVLCHLLCYVRCLTRISGFLENVSFCNK